MTTYPRDSPAEPSRRRVRTAFTTVVATVVVSTALVACSVRPQDHPDVVAVGPLITAVHQTPTVAAPSSRQATVFFVGDGRLVSVDRHLPTGDPITRALEALVAGPGPQDPEGLQSALPAGTTGWQVAVTDEVATIAVPAAFDRLGARNEVVAVGQLVFTVTAQPGVRGVLFTSDGSPIEIPVDSGRLVARPVTRTDYPTIAPL